MESREVGWTRFGEKAHGSGAGPQDGACGTTRPRAGMKAAFIGVPVAHRVRPADDNHAIARAAMRSLWHELALYPKPGLVSLHDSGSHADMDAATFIRSLFALARYWSEIAKAGAAAAPFETLR